MRRPENRALVLVNSASWLEACTLHDGRCRVEFHLPRREASVGYVNKPTVAEGEYADLRRLVRRVLDGRFGAVAA